MSHTASTTLGVTMRDRVTGFAGICTAFCSYLTGCDQVALQPTADEKGAVPDARWFDVTRLEVLPAERIVIETTPAEVGADPYVLRAPGMRGV